LSYLDRQVRERLIQQLLARLAAAKQTARAAYEPIVHRAQDAADKARATAIACRLGTAGRAAVSRLDAGWRAFAGTAFARALRDEEVRFWVSLAVVIGALLSGVATFLIMYGVLPINVTDDLVETALGISTAFVLAMIGIVGFQIVKLLKARKRQAAGAGLHFKIVGVFSLAALFPAVLFAIFGSVSVKSNIDALLSNHVGPAVNNSVELAKLYMAEKRQIIGSDVEDIAHVLEENSNLFRDNKAEFDRFFSALVTMRSLPAAFLIDSEGRLISPAAGDLREYPVPPPADMARIAGGQTVLLDWAHGIAALDRLNGFDGLFLYALRPLNENVYKVLIRTQRDFLGFKWIEQQRGPIEFAFSKMYVLLALTLITSAIWTGLGFANRLVMPIRKLIGAAQEVSQGNLNVQLDAAFARDDIGRLGATFKKMTVDLKTQRDDIMSANAQLDERRRFIEAVLSGVTAGVIGLDSEGCVTLINRSARELLRLKEAKLIGKPLKSAVPEFAEIIEKSRRQGRSKPVQSQITLVRESGERNFAVQVTREADDKADYGVIVTFDDVTELTAAQRTSAWADVARRIAHEIKNPLTPIQLSAERIRRKYGDSIKSDREVFDKCTDTIIRHVGDIGRMVDEFSAFARMPQAVFEEQDVREIVREAVILFQMSRPEIEYKIESVDEPLIALCDRRLLTQAVTNLVKNASEAVDSYANGNGHGGEKGQIVIRLRSMDQRFVIGVIDNGCGLPKENRHRLVEPYVTTRQKGTGLGLAIVQRITEQHGGVLELDDAPANEGYAHGAWIRMSIPVLHAADGVEAEIESAKPNGQERASASGASANRGKEGVSHGV
jgi:two-component system, NtrC family, nitrogen regulation sensor histidine kinase NtrY